MYISEKEKDLKPPVIWTLFLDASSLQQQYMWPVQFLSTSEMFYH